MYTILTADYSNASHAKDIIRLMSLYARSEMGGAKDLTARVKALLVAELAGITGTFSILCYEDNNCIGLANCFMGFSTFHCKPLINIHDFYVVKNLRGKNIAGKILQAIEDIAQKRHCCKITLEVLDENTSAKQAYRKFGFHAYTLTAKTEGASFWEKPIEPLKVNI